MSNKFENNLQKQFESWQLPPQPRVWENIEQRLHKKKRRPIIFWWFWALPIVLIGSGLFFWMNDTTLSKATKQTETTNYNITKITNTIKQAHLEAKTNLKTDNSHKKQAKKPLLIAEKTAKITDFSRKKISNKQPKLNVELGENNSFKRVFVSNANKEASKIPATKNDVKTITETAVSIVNLSEQEPQKTETNQSDIKKTVIEYTKKDSSQNANQLTTDSLAAILNKKMPVTPNKKHRFNQHLSIGGGWLYENNQQFVLGNQVPGNNLESSFSNASPGSISASRNIISTIETGRYFQAAWLLQYSLSNRWKVETGLQYSFLTNTLKTGAAKDTNTANFSQPFYYTNGNNFSRTNYMHQITVPLTVQYAFNIKKNNPILLGTGFAITQPIANNWLVHNNTNGIAYYQNQLMPALFLQLQSKLSIPVCNGWYVHAVYQQQLNALHKNNLSPKFLSQFGIQISKKIK